jgi:tRNA G37 N-methylase TrmD
LPEGLLATRIQVLTIFPELFGPFLETALLGGRASAVC